MSSRARIARRPRAIVWPWGVALALAIAMTASTQAAEVALRLRISWGGGAERIWNGAVRMPGGTLADLTALGIEADEPGAVWLHEGSEVDIRQRSLRGYDGIDVLVRGDTTAKLMIELSSDGATQPEQVEIPLDELIDGVHTSTLDDTGNRLSVTRSPGDRLRVEFDRPHLVFEPGESFEFRVEPYLIGTSTAGTRLQALITTSPSGQRVWSESYITGAEGTDTAISLPAPKEEGVYDLTISAVAASRLKQKLQLRPRPLVERKIQFVVIQSQPTTLSGEAPTAKVLEINPVNSRWWERLASLPPLPGFNKGPLGNGDAATWNHPSLGPLVQLGPGGEPPDVSWEAYPLPIAHPGQVHVLEIEYPSDVPQAMGISLVEPNAAGAVMPIGLDSGVYVSDEEAATPARMARHRVVFWPKTKTPLVLITNRRPGARAVYGKISVLSAPQSQLAVLALGKSDGSTLPPAFADELRGERLWAGYMDRPLLAENFGAPEAFDAQSGRSLDDWNTFHQGGTRLVKYLRHVGYNGLMLSVLADGSTIYPSELVAPTPRYDTGAFFATGQDPRRKDALELLFRLFDRERLVLIPALQFAAPLPELEAIKRAGGAEADGIEWIGADGQPMLVSTAQQGLAPYYNLLDARVQAALLKVAREVIVRYGAHEAFGGIALQLSPESYAQLPSDAFGFDDRTIARFERDTKARVPGEGPERFATREKHLTGPARPAWLQWRTRVVSDFHRQLEREIAAVRPGAKLYLAGGTMLEGPRMQAELRPTLSRRAKIDESFQELGLPLSSYSSNAGITVLRPVLLRPNTAPPPAGAADAELYLSRDMDALFAAGGQRGTLFFHEPQKARLASFDVKSPFGSANTYAWLVSHMSPSGDRNRRRFVHSLAVADAAEMFDGGWMLSLGQEDTLKNVLSVYRQLPEAPFETVPGEFQPVTIRSLSHEGKTYVYLVNDSPWPVGVTLEMELPASCQMEILGAGEGVGPLERAVGRTTWQVALKPFDLAAARFTAADARVLGVTVSLPPSVSETLERRIEDLVARVRALGIPLLENPSFELPLVNQQIAGWAASIASGGRIALDSRWFHSGARSVLMSSTGPAVRILSAPIVPPHAGPLSVEVWLRTADAEKAPSVRIGVEGETFASELGGGPTAGGQFSRHGVIDRVGATASNPGVWVHYTFPIDNIPTEGLANLRVRLELVGEGEVWVDDVQVRSFSSRELVELTKINTMASLHLEKMQYADCARLLDGYWPQFLVASVPLTTANTPIARRPKPPQPQPAAPEKTPSLFETMRSYLPPVFR